MRDNDQTAEIVPVFPLPNVVLFPSTVLPLHVFEPRYRDMVRDVARGDRRMAVGLLQPGYEAEYEGHPAIHPIGTVGRIEQLEPLPDGRYLLNVVGLRRVEFREIPTDRSYRLVRAAPRPEIRVDESDPSVREAKLKLLASHACLVSKISGAETGVVLDDKVPLEAAINGSCANMPVEALVRQQLLQLDDLGQRLREAGRLVDRILRQVLEVESSGEDGSGSDVH